MSLYIPKMSDTPAITIPGLADNFSALEGSQIVESGSNENGEYWRWENGLQVCVGRNITCNNVERAARIISGRWRYPAPFVNSTIYMHFVASATATYYSPTSLRFRPLIAQYETPGTQEGNVEFRLADDGDIDDSYALVVVRALAIGRWK